MHEDEKSYGKSLSEKRNDLWSALHFLPCLLFKTILFLSSDRDSCDLTCILSLNCRLLHFGLGVIILNRWHPRHFDEWCQSGWVLSVRNQKMPWQPYIQHFFFLICRSIVFLQREAKMVQKNIYGVSDCSLSVSADFIWNLKTHWRK